MAKKFEIYKCEICGNIVEMLHGGAGTLVCCGADMQLYEENTTDAATEKHVPVVEKAETGIKVKVGEVPHPMEDKHFIEWIQLICETGSCRKFLNPGDTPEIEFAAKPDEFTIRAYCNLHGLWKS